MEATTALIWLTLVTLATPNSDNATEAGFDYNMSTTSRGRSRPSYSSSYYISPTLSTVFYVITVITAVVGCLANAYVLLALLLNKKSRASNVNVFITHQVILDLTACAFLLLGLVMRPANMNHATATFLCLIFKNYTISSTAGNASICGLIIITIERYVKIVHPVAYRNHYRPWMTRAGIVIPWIFGFCTNFLPTVLTTKLIRGRCIRARLPPIWNVAKFVLVYLGPLAFIVFGYWKILAVIRRQRKQVGDSQPKATSAAAKAAEKTSRRTEINVIRSMVLVSVSFAVCFVCMRVYAILTSTRVVPGIGALYLLFSVFTYTNRCLNPFIYATQYEVVRRWWKAVVYRVVCGQNLMEEGPTTTTANDEQKAAQNQATTKNL